MSIEGRVAVPGAVLQYRRAGTGNGPLLVFENGWGASYHYWAWVERELAPHAQLLFYDRAGIGGSEIAVEQSASNLSQQFAALLDALAITEPVVVIGHSYGGLIGALHLALQPQAVRALIQVDASPWQRDRTLDASFLVIRALVPMLKLYSVMGWRDPLFAPACATLPAPEAELLLTRSFGSLKSLRSASVELRLLNEIRTKIASSPSDKPRLILSAHQSPGRKQAAIVSRMQSQHRAYAARGIGANWGEVPHSHSALVFSEAGAADVAARIRGFLRETVGLG